jgi:hypothetical protein
MSIPVHREGDLRQCGATTVVEGQSTVFANNMLVSVKDDPDSHGTGELLADNNDGTVFIGGKEVVLKDSNAKPDNVWKRKQKSSRRKHKNPYAATASPNVYAC